MNTVSITSDNFAHAWIKLLEDIWNRGCVVQPRGTMTKELVAVKLHVEHMERNILVHPARNLNYRFMLAEWLWIMAGRNDVKTVAKYNSKIRAFSEDGETFFGAYGPRLIQEIENIHALLRADRNCRQAVATIYKSSADAMAGTRDTPCTLSLQVLIRNNKLHGIVNMRSSDIWLGLPYDFFNFSMMCIMLATELDVKPGSLTFNLGSSHLYVENSFHVIEVLSTIGRTFIEHVKSPDVLKIPYAGFCWPTTFNQFWDSVDEDMHLDYLPTPWGDYQKALETTKWSDSLEHLKQAARTHYEAPNSR